MSSNRSWTTGFCTTERQPRNTMNFRLKSTTFASFYFLDGAVTKVPVIPARLPDFHDSLIFLLFILLNWFTLRQNLRKRIQNDLPWFKVIDMCVCVFCSGASLEILQLLYSRYIYIYIYIYYYMIHVFLFSEYTSYHFILNIILNELIWFWILNFSRLYHITLNHVHLNQIDLSYIILYQMVLGHFNLSYK